jgi:lipopolysaccharide export system protein LptA
MGKSLNRTFFIRKTLVLLLLLQLGQAAFAQTKEQIEIIRADEWIFTKRDGKNTQRLLGDVQFKHQNALMFCDSAYLYQATNAIDAFGSIRINQGDTLNLYGDLLHYEGDEQLATVDGEEVKLISPDFELTTDRLFYDRLNNVAHYASGGTIVSKNDSNTLVSQIGYFYANQNLFTFKNKVVLENPDFIMRSDTLHYYTSTEVVSFYGPTTITGDSNLIYCENGWYDTRKDQSKYFKHAYIISDSRQLQGDTLFYDRLKGYGQADGNMLIKDTLEQVIVKGEHGKIFEKRDSAIVTDQCLMIQLLDGDSLFMHADTFKLFEVDGVRNLMAYYGVKIFKSDLQGKCDSIIYSLSDSTIRLFNDPVLWSENNQLTADSVYIRTANNKIHSIQLDWNAFIIAEIDSIRYNQIKGKKMTGYFKNGSLARIDVRGNGQTTYYGQDDKNKFIGVNVAESTDINIRLKEQGIHTITFINDPDASMHPMKELDPLTDLRYRGFHWRVEERPINKEAVFD